MKSPSGEILYSDDLCPKSSEVFVEYEKMMFKPIGV